MVAGAKIFGSAGREGETLSLMIGLTNRNTIPVICSRLYKWKMIKMRSKRKISRKTDPNGARRQKTRRQVTVIMASEKQRTLSTHQDNRKRGPTCCAILVFVTVVCDLGHVQLTLLVARTHHDLNFLLFLCFSSC